jgi:hypothetical protein
MNFLHADYPCIPDIILAMELELKTKIKEDREVDMDDFVYETISLWDRVFEGDEEWFNEDETDLKDSLRDQVLEFLGYQP